MNIGKARRVHISHFTGVIAAMAALLLLTHPARSASPQSAPKVGEEYEITKRYQTTDQASGGSSGSSSGRDTLLERVIAVRDDGLELEYDLPKAATAEDRARSWQFPVRVSRSANGTVQLLNHAELEARVEGWLKAGGWTRAACGQWIFTWNAFRIDCDPQSVIATLAAFDLRSVDLREGAAYRDNEAAGTGTLTKRTAGPDGTMFAVDMDIDPDAVRRARAEADVAVGQILQKPVTLEEALRARANDSVSGTVMLTFDTDPDGNLRSRTKVTKVETVGPDGKTEIRTVTETVERRAVAE